MSDNLDSILVEFGNPGRFQLLVFCLAWFNTFQVALNHLSSVFYGYVPPHICKQNINSTGLANVVNTVNSSISIDKSCEAFTDPYNPSLGTGPCKDGWEYELEDREWFLATEWNLVCDKRYLLTLGITIYFIGVMAGGVLFGAPADKYGRWKIIFGCLICEVIVGFGISFVTSFSVFIALKFFQGICLQGIQTTTFTLNVELFHPKLRFYIALAESFAWCLGSMLIAGLAWSIRDWRQIQLTISLLGIINIIFMLFVPESVRWLMAEGKPDTACTILRRFARFNRLSVRSDLGESLDVLAKNIVLNKTRSGSMLDLIRTPIIRKTTFKLILAWLTMGMTYYGLAYVVVALKINKYASLMASGAADVVWPIILSRMLPRCGRRVPLAASFAVTGFCCIISALLLNFAPAGATSAVGIVILVLSITGKSFNGGSFSGTVLYTSELYPTVIRNLALGFHYIWARFGGTIAPQFMFLGQLWAPLPLLMFGLCGVASGVLVYGLRETLNEPMPNTVLDVEHASKLRRKSRRSMDMIETNFSQERNDF